VRSRGLGKRTVALREFARAELERIQPASVRAVCYRLFIAGLIPDMGKASTNGISRMLTRAREDGVIPWEWIVDESRSAESTRTWSNPEEIIRAAVRGYRRDYWQDQKHLVEVWSEKGTVRGTLAPVLDRYGVTFRVMHGYASATVLKEVANLSRSTRKDFVVLYVGDHDPSGKHMSDCDLPRRLHEYGAVLSLERVALVERDLADLPSFDPESKTADSRYEWFVKHIGTRCYELDAMQPPQLRSRVEAEIRLRLDLALWEQSERIEQTEIESMRSFHRSWRASISPDGEA
jgi:hypothetical protein